MKPLEQICQEIYETQGSSGVMSFIEKEQNYENYPFRVKSTLFEEVRHVHFAFCEPCDADMPMLYNVCLVCGQPLKKSIK